MIICNFVMSYLHILDNFLKAPKNCENANRVLNISLELENIWSAIM